MPGRTCEEIKAIAHASPYWESFVGDGASVPWEWITPPAGTVLWLYKQYLDALAPQCFKLHDFFYSPYVPDYGVTKEECDFCLYECLYPLDPVSAAIVWTAVRIGGAPYFHQPPPVHNRDNMGLVAHEGGLPMARFKCTMLFQQITNVSQGAQPAITRVGGWSESFYGTFSDAATAARWMNGTGGGTFSLPNLCPARAALLGRGGAIVGQRIQTVPPAGPSLTLANNFPGTTTTPVDVPQMALLCNGLNGVGRRVRVVIRGIPDQYVVEGEFRPTPTYSARLLNYFSALSAFETGGRDTTVPTYDILNVTGVGLLTSLVATPFTIGQMVQIVGTTDAYGNKKSGVFQVTNLLPLTLQVQLAGWTFGATTGGIVRASAAQFGSIIDGSLEVSRVVQRKVGGPFVRFRGRASKRKR